MSRQQGEERQQQQPSGSRSRPNLYLDFSRPYERQYNQQTGENRPVQSGFVSSTNWKPGDSTWYKAQTIYAPSNNNSEPVQDSTVTNSQEESSKHLLREFFNGQM